MTEAVTVKGAQAHTVDFTAPEALSSGEIIQLADGRAAVTAGLSAVDSGDPAAGHIGGTFAVTKSAGKVVIEGGRLWWDRSASAATPIQPADGFYLGVAAADASSAATTVNVHLNVLPSFTAELGKTGFTTEATNGLGVVALPGSPGVKLAFDAVAEAAQAAIYSDDTFPVADGGIVEFKAAIFDIGDDAALDINIGVANGSHATDADTIAESVFLHLDGSALDIKAESDDGTNETAATDTTINAVDDTAFEGWIDLRDPSDVKIYVDGVQVLSATTFDISDATGPLKFIAHVEKTSNDTTAELRVLSASVRTTDLA